MIRVLIAIDDSPPALAAAALAISYAKTHPAQLHFVTVAEPGTDTTVILGHATGLAGNAGVTATAAATDGGQPFEALLAEAHHWDADVIVMGRSDIRRPGQPYVGSQTEHLLEFTDIPVLVVPEPHPGHSHDVKPPPPPTTQRADDGSPHPPPESLPRRPDGIGRSRIEGSPGSPPF